MGMTSAARIANDSAFCESRESMKKLEDALSNEAAMNASLSDIEQLLKAQGRELLREMMQAHFDLRSAQERPVKVTDADGVEHAKVRRGRGRWRRRSGKWSSSAICTKHPA